MMNPLESARVCRQAARAWRQLGQGELAAFWYKRARGWLKVVRYHASP